MKKFRFILTRDITESAEVVVEAETEEDAGDKAEEMAFMGDLEWSVDDNSPKRPYITDTEELE
mgnify:CR=1 FL=1|jgi:hypothetical protein